MSNPPPLKLGDEQKVKAAGKMGHAGKEYVDQDGDICHFRFNVSMTTGPRR